MMYWLPPTSNPKDELIKTIGNKNQVVRTHIIPSSFHQDGGDKATFLVPHVCLESPRVKTIENLSTDIVRR